MKSKLLFLFAFFYLAAWAQAPVIEGDLMLCPDENGTTVVTGDVTYDTYQWYYKYWFLNDDFEAIDGATSSSFTYDWFTYDQALFKVVVTLDGETFESNTIQIDSYNWVSLLLSYDLGENVTIDGDNGDLLMCEDTSLEVHVGMPYTVVTWYKDGEIIEGETSTTYTITQAGVYHVVAAPDMCPNATSTSLPLVVYVVECESDIDNPIIEGNVMLCPYEDGTATITNTTTYDSYQWHYKYWFSDDDFETINGATSSTFTYDWMTYDQALIKVVVTLDGETFESNTIQIDSYNWNSLLLSYDLGDNVTYDADAEIFYMCEGTTLEINVIEPYTVVTWFKDGEVIEGETSTSYTITEAGSYHVMAAPDICPNATSTSLALNIQMTECDLNVENPNRDLSVQLYPNPVNDILYISSSVVEPISNYLITDTTGRIINKGEFAGSENSISFQHLPSGIYIVNIKGENHNSVHKIIKK